MREPENLLHLAEYAVREGLKLGADEVEAYASRIKYAEATAHNNRLESAVTTEESGLGVRVVIRGRVGFTYVNTLSEDEVRKAVERAYKVAKSVPPDSRWPGLPEPSKYPDVRGTYSRKLVGLNVEDVVGFIKEILEEALKDRRITLVYGWVSVGEGAEAISNSNGVSAWDRSTSASVGVEVVAREAGETTPLAYEADVSRVEVPDVRNLASKCVEKAVKSLKPVKVEPNRYIVLLTPNALSALLTYAFKPALEGDNVARGKSPLTGKLGEEVVSRAITVVDDGTLPEGFASGKFDGEGVPMRRKILIANGVLKSFIYDNYWGKISGTESTGNGVRASYATLPNISFTNFIVDPGGDDLEEVMNSSEKLILVDQLQGAHSSNPETGDFSVVATPSWLVSKGETKPLKGTMIAGNVWDALKEVRILTKQYRKVGTDYLPWVGVELMVTSGP